MIITRKISLRKKILLKIENQHPELHSKTPWLIRIFSFFSDRSNWLWVLILVIVLFALLTSVNLKSFAFINIQANVAEVLIDQRTSNVATIISMTLAIIGLILSNLAIKEPLTYKLLFIKSRLFFIIYYTLSTILCLMVISTFRDFFVLHGDMFQRLVLAGSYMAMSILFLIGYLFRSIIQYANANHLHDIITNELYRETKQNIQLTLLSKYSKAEFISIMDRMGIEEYSVAKAFSSGAISSPVDLFKTPDQNSQRLVFDIDLRKLEKILGKDKGTSKRYFTSISLNIVTDRYVDFIWGGSENMPRLSRCITLRNPSRELKVSMEYRAYFDKKLEEYIEEGKFRKVEEVLQFFLNIYELEIKY